MIYGYIRVSTDKQTVENQRFEIENFATRKGIKIEEWIEETISGKIDIEKRKLGSLLKRLTKGDILICSELSRLGRALFMVMEILNYCMKNEVQVWTLKENYILGDDITSKVLAFAFGLAAEIERKLISERTKEGMRRRMRDGQKMGRPVGRKTIFERHKLYPHIKQIQKMISKGLSKKSISKKVGVHRDTLSRFINNEGYYNFLA